MMQITIRLSNDKDLGYNIVKQCRLWNYEASQLRLEKYDATEDTLYFVSDTIDMGYSVWLDCTNMTYEEARRHVTDHMFYKIDRLFGNRVRIFDFSI